MIRLNHHIFGYALAISFLVALAQASTGVPVLIYSKLIEDQNSVVVGTKMSSEDFLENINNLIKSNVQVIYVNQLSDQDIRGELNSLRGHEAINYYPSVESPHKTLSESLNAALTSTYEYADATAALQMFNSKMLDSKTKTLILTGKDSLAKRSKRQASAPSGTNDTVYATGANCAAQFDLTYIIDQTSGINGFNWADLMIDRDNTKFDCLQNGTSILTIPFKNATEKTLYITSAVLRFGLLARSWIYTTGEIKTTSPTASKSYNLAYMDAPYGMETPIGYSYACTSSRFVLVNQDDKQTQTKINFYIENFQFQAFNTSMNTTGAETVYKYGNVNYCQGFFSNAIWMAISASLILVTILTFGVSFLMKVNTMDKFDDPKGKPLNIAIEK